MKMFPAIDMVATGAQIQALRIKSGYSVKDLQEVFGFSDPQAIYRWQWGQSLPRVDNLVALSVLFGVTIDSILVLEQKEDAVSAFYRLNFMDLIFIGACLLSAGSFFIVYILPFCIQKAGESYG